MNTMTMDSEIKAVAQAAVPAEFEHPDYGAIKTRQQATWGRVTMGVSVSRCRSPASNCAKRWIFAPAGRCSTWPG